MKKLKRGTGCDEIEYIKNVKERKKSKIEIDIIDNNLKVETKPDVPWKLTNIIDCSDLQSAVTLPCRSIRIGNYKVHGARTKDVTITRENVLITVPTLVNTPAAEIVTVEIALEDILSVDAQLNKPSPLLCLTISPAAWILARETLRMNISDGASLNSEDDKQRRIIIVPQKLIESNKTLLKKHLGGKIQEVTPKEANDILVNSSFK